MVADCVGFLASGLYFSVYFSIFGEHAAQIFEFIGLLQLGSVDVDIQFVWSLTDSHDLGLAGADLHAVCLAAFIELIYVLL